MLCSVLEGPGIDRGPGIRPGNKVWEIVDVTVRSVGGRVVG